MNLLISLPAGIIVIMAIFMLLARFTKNSAYAIGGIIALLVIMIYGMIAAINWPGADVFAIHIALYLLTVYGMTIATSQRQNRVRKRSKLHWAPVTLFVFFGIILVTDSVLILLAQSGVSPDWATLILPEPRARGEVRSVFPGTVSHDFREKSGQFNEYKQQREKQQHLGWSVIPGWKQEAYSNISNTLLLQVKKRDGSLLRGATISARFLYPADSSFDQTINLQDDESGLYHAPVTLTRPGDWEMVLSIHHKDGDYEMRVRTSIQQDNGQR